MDVSPRPFPTWTQDKEPSGFVMPDSIDQARRDYPDQYSSDGQVTEILQGDDELPVSDDPEVQALMRQIYGD